MSDTPLSPLPPREVWDRLDPLSPSLGAHPAELGLADLPYGKLDGPGFERLCYQLLVAEGHHPRFFGRRGQPDLGVDIVVDEPDGDRIYQYEPDAGTVYQCKNL